MSPKYAIVLFVMVRIFTRIEAQPAIEAVAPLFDAGSIHAGTRDTLVHPFTIKNTGTRALVIDRVVPDCGCSVVEFPRTVAPGASARIIFKIHIVSFDNLPHQKTAILHSNAHNTNALKLTVRYTLKRAVYHTKRFLRLRTPKENTAPGSITLYVKDSTFTVTRVAFRPRSTAAAPPVFFRQGSKSGPDTEGYYTVTTTFFVKKHPARPLYGTLHVYTTDDQNRELTFDAMIESPIP